MESIEPDRRCTIFPRSADVNAPSAPPVSDQLSSNTISTEERTEASSENNRRIRKQRKHGNRFDVGIKRNSQEEHKSSKKPVAPFCKNYGPWMEFQKFLAEGSPGKTCLANAIKSPGLVVAIKQYQNNGIKKTHHLLRPANSNVVDLMYAFSDGNVISLAYEYMPVNLEQLHSSIILTEPDIALVCIQILHGLWYIHRDLCICHTRIQCDNIFISLTGIVKIGDIGASLLEQHKGSEQNDIRSVGWIVFEIIAPGEADGSSRRLSLNPSTECSSDLRSFLTATESKPIPKLLQHDFLLKPAKDGSLVAPVMKVRPFVLHDYE